jgi:NADH dehydrogenase FAD-containing subunit
MALQFNQVVGAGATGVEPSGNVRFTVEVTGLPGPILEQLSIT